ncbi:glycoside hydrolase family 13 protein [Massilia sp. TS11]|uniref:glycoside hydrolase family 13 protein n=1 Tax=Massilia sp. TS11 TaxID=2908003 RepID=UPI001EDC0B53|nr:glycoside hydrolase family 13 protein [Massilia sp. TS11]MCG2585206.1 glycoside hydrolase family 13 protein [Massilia sp. TS11]
MSKRAMLPLLALLCAALPALAADYAKREQDWRNGAVVYQVLPDRFAPAANLAAKKALYPAPKILRSWEDSPKRGSYDPVLKVDSHELEFWGGDLPSIRSRLDYVQDLGADVLYLNPVHLAWTNHKYDALDYQQISPEFGTRADLKALAEDLHRRGMRLVLDGVFNHMGRNAPRFQQALKDPNSPYRHWFVFGEQYPGGARSWWQFENLPELNLEFPTVRQYLYGAPDSVVRSYLKDGADGWRLDVAVDIGYQFLSELSKAAHDTKPGSLIVGEIANYPRDWFPAVDGVMNFTLREIILRTAERRMEAALAARMIERMVNEAGVENLLKSWIFLDNHDTARLHTALTDERQRRLAQVLQFTLPGSPNLYYGSELGMQGLVDPEQRGPMRWDWVGENNIHLQWTRQLIQMHKRLRALRVGDFRLATSDKLLAFERYTDHTRDTVLVLANPGYSTVTEAVMVANSNLMNTFALVDQLSGQKVPMRSGLVEVSLAPGAAMVLVPELSPGGGYSAYKRVP